jgi:hypothetical protein
MPWGQKHREAAEAVADHCLRDRPLGAKGRQDPTEAVECAETAPVAAVQALLGPMVDSEVAVQAAAVEARLPVAEAVPAAVQAQVLAVEAPAQPGLMAGRVAKGRVEAPAQPGLMAGREAVVPAAVLGAQAQLGLTEGPEVVAPAAVQAQVLVEAQVQLELVVGWVAVVPEVGQAEVLPAEHGAAVPAVLRQARPVAVLGALAQRRRFRAAMVPRGRKVVLPAGAASRARLSAATG